MRSKPTLPTPATVPTRVGRVRVCAQNPHRLRPRVDGLALVAVTRLSSQLVGVDPCSRPLPRPTKHLAGWTSLPAGRLNGLIAVLHHPAPITEPRTGDRPRTTRRQSTS